jgi:prolyl oligopeptidase
MLATAFLVLCASAFILCAAGAAVYAGEGMKSEGTKPEAAKPRPAAPATKTASAPQRLTYPVARKGDQVDDYHGTKVADPYRWLEDPDSPESRAWIETENTITFGWLEQIPERERIRKRLRTLWNYERYSVPFFEGKRYFFSKNDGLQNQAVLYTAGRLDAPPRVLLDPNLLSEDGTVALSALAVSRDGRRLAYGLSGAGSDWVEFKVRDVDTGKDLDDHLKWVKFSGASWARDGSGFYYSRYDEPNEKTMLEDVNYFQKLYFHRLGTPQSADRLVYERRDKKEWGFGGTVTEDGRYLVIQVWVGTEPKNGVFYKDLARDGAVVELLRDFDAAYEFVGNDGPLFWFRTDLEAPRGRLIGIDTRAPERSRWKEIIPQSEATLEGVSVVGERFIARYLQDASSRVRLFTLEGKPEKDLALPALGTAAGFPGKRADRETFYGFTSFTFPMTIYRYDFDTGESSVFKRPSLELRPEDYETKQVFYRSKDGTRVPMFITHRKGLALDGGNPTLLYGYGGFDVSETPAFSVANLVWMEMGGVYALANLRGGGEYGEEWHQAGIKAKKQNVFDDFIAAAEWLNANRYTSSPKLAIEGGSNGGLLVGACLTQRPDLFGAALPAVGVMDMLRFHKFTIGWAWVSDYGSSDNAEEFRALYAYSPLHNIRPGVSYPPTFITTADHDDRVVPAHSFKFAATLQAAQAGPVPVLIRIETRAGHGAGKPTAKLIDEVGDRWAFLVRSLEITLPSTFP